MARLALHSPQVLRQLLDYAPSTGRISWRPRRAGLCVTRRANAVWNAQFAGREAFVFKKPNGYLSGSILGRTYSAHRVAWAIHYGEWPSQEIDHLNRVRDDNRIGNLRDISSAENSKNTGLKSNNTSGVTGVWWASHISKWQARMRVNGKNYHLGVFDDFQDAVAARASAEGTHGFIAGMAECALSDDE